MGEKEGLEFIITSVEQRDERKKEKKFEKQFSSWVRKISGMFKELSLNDGVNSLEDRADSISCKIIDGAHRCIQSIVHRREQALAFDGIFFIPGQCNE